MAWSEPGETLPGNVAEPLVDDELWGALAGAIREARETLDLTQLLFDADIRPPGSAPLAELIERAAARGVRVRLLLNENRAVPDSVDELRERFRGTTIQLAAIPMSPNVLHAKILLVDDVEAFLIDPPFQQKYVDTPLHARLRATRGRSQPLHAVSLRLRGPSVARLAQIFAALWNGARLPAPAPGGAPAGRQAIEIAWTTPGGILHETAHEGILASYERALACARRFVYLETQYFTSPRIARLLGDALAREPSLEAIILLNTHMDIPGYDAWQEARLREIDAFDHPRIGVFTLQNAARAEATPIYVHSKVAIVDDAWATLGSANLDSVSLHEGTEFPIPVPHNVEINATLLDGIDGAPTTGAVANLRRRLWSEHLGAAGIWRAAAPPEGWLAVWRAAADANARALDAGATRTGRVFAYRASEGSARKANGIPAHDGRAWSIRKASSPPERTRSPRWTTPRK